MSSSNSAAEHVLVAGGTDAASADYVLVGDNEFQTN
jgi:hypothetical protein